MVVVVNKTRKIKNVEIKKPIEKGKIVEKTQSRIKGKSKEKSNNASGNNGGLLDEKGNPYPKESSDGGKPICEGGFKIDRDFDPFNDPINPPFRCIPALKDPDDIKNKIMNSLKNPSSNVKDISVTAPSAGGGQGGSKKKRARSSHRHARSPHRHARSPHRHARSPHRHARSHRRLRSHVGRNKKI